MKALTKSLAVAVEATVDTFVAAHDAQVAMKATGESFTGQLLSLYRSVQSKDDSTFFAIFGTGGTVKKPGGGQSMYQEGALGSVLRKRYDAKIALADKDDAAATVLLEAERKTKLQVLKSRLNVVRKFNAESMVIGPKATWHESIQRLQKQTSTGTGETHATQPAEKQCGSVSIPESANVDDVVAALSLWVAKHGQGGSLLLARQLADFMPVSVRRQRVAP